MTIALVTHSQGAGLSTASSAAINCTGATFLVFGAGYSSTAVPTFSDTSSNTWNTSITAEDTGTRATKVVYVANATVSSSQTFTAAQTNQTCGFGVASFSGVDTSSPFDVRASASQSGVTAVQGGSITPSQSNSLILSIFTHGTAAISGVAVDSGFTLLESIPRNSGVNVGCYFAYLIQGSAAAVNPNWTWTTAVGCSCLNVVFKPVAAAANVTRPIALIIG